MYIYLYNSFENIPGGILKKSVSVVIDVLRASTTISTALLNGCKKIYPVETVEKALALNKNLDKGETLLCGERKGKKVEGFNLGNSPFEYDDKTVKGKSIILTTTNGTYSLLMVSKSKEVIVCGFVNIQKVVDYIKNKKNVVIVLSGKERRFSMEDAVCGGMLLDLLLKDNIFVLNDEGSAILRIYQTLKDNYKECLKASEHGIYLKKIGFGKDLDYCFNLNTHNVLPVFKDGVIINGG